MDRESAEKTILIAIQANSLLNQCLMNLQEVLPAHDYKACYPRFGKAMGSIYLDILQPIYDEHPDLLPTEMGGPYSFDQSMFFKLYALALKNAEENS